MDELLQARVKQLREIDDRLDRIDMKGDYDGGKTFKAIQDLRNDITMMIQQAEAEHAAF